MEYVVYFINSDVPTGILDNTMLDHYKKLISGDLCAYYYLH